jgi:NifB/MoaA-like Fe-S oxidoreductase
MSLLQNLVKFIKFAISPLHVSIHSFNPAVRSVLFGNKKSMKALDNFRTLDSNGIKTNIQIVLCPGINDGQDLEDTLSSIINDFNNILSTGIVP